MNFFLLLFGLSVLASVNMWVFSRTQSTVPKGVALACANVIRASIWFLGGFIVTEVIGGSLVQASVLGPILFLVDHVLLKGGKFYREKEYRAFKGVLLSYAMFFWVPLLVSWLGGRFGISN